MVPAGCCDRSSVRRSLTGFLRRRQLQGSRRRSRRTLGEVEAEVLEVYLHASVTDAAFAPDETFIPLHDITHEPFAALWQRKAFVASLLLSDDEAVPCVRGLTTASLTEGSRLELWNVVPIS